MFKKKPAKPKEKPVKKEKKESVSTMDEKAAQQGVLPDDIDFHRGMGCG